MIQKNKEQCKEQHGGKECIGKGWYVVGGKYHQRVDKAKRLSSTGRHLQHRVAQESFHAPSQSIQTEPISVESESIYGLDQHKFNVKQDVLIGVATDGALSPPSKDSSPPKKNNDAKDENEEENKDESKSSRIQPVELGLRVYFPGSE